MSQQEQTEIWLLLVDRTGQPLSQTSYTKVTFNCVPDVDKFRKAVKTECPNSLSSVDSNCLKVFRNMDSFKNNEDSLDEEMKLFGFGMSKKDALIVVVPSGFSYSMKLFIS